MVTITLLVGGNSRLNTPWIDKHPFQLSGRFIPCLVVITLVSQCIIFAGHFCLAYLLQSNEGDVYIDNDEIFCPHQTEQEEGAAQRREAVSRWNFQVVA